MKRLKRPGAAQIVWGLCCALLLAPVAARSATPATEAAIATSTFVNTIGIVTHFNYERTYRDDAPTVIGLLGDSGIRHIRDGFGDPKSRELLASLASRGVKVDLVTQQGLRITTMVGYPSLLPPGMVDAFEGPNELDMALGGDAYLSILHSFMPALYNAVKADPRTSSIPVIGPSLTSQRSYEAAGDLSAYMDYGNMHNYVWGRNPGTPGWDGPIHYGSIPFMMNAARRVSGTKPIMTTEIGYGTSSKSGEVTEATQLKYLMRTFFEQALNGVKRTYSYEFLDDGAKAFNTYGIVRHDLSPKPSYTGLKNLIKLLDDPGSPRTDSLHYMVDGAPSVHHYLLEKSDGRFYLALWNETKSFSLAKGGDERESRIAPVPVDVTLDRSIAGAKIYSFDQTGNLTAKPVSAGKTVPMSVTDGVSILEWQPSEP